MRRKRVKERKSGNEKQFVAKSTRDAEEGGVLVLRKRRGPSEREVPSRKKNKTKRKKKTERRETI